MSIRYPSFLLPAITVLVASLTVTLAKGNEPGLKEGDWVVRDFRFHTGEVMPELRLHYTTIGEPTGQPVLILHGTTGSGSMLPRFGGELFGDGQALDASKYYIILPDAIGHGKSAKPSDGLRSKFPHYNYDDMVIAQYRLASIRSARIAPPSPGARELHGRHAHLDLGREVP